MKICLLKAWNIGKTFEGTYEMKGQRVLIGREKVCDFVINDNTVSRQHCEIIREGEAFKVRNLPSKAGVKLLRGSKEPEGPASSPAENNIAAHPLSTGDRLILGAVTVLVEIRDDAVAVADSQNIPSGAVAPGAKSVGGTLRISRDAVADRLRDPAPSEPMPPKAPPPAYYQAAAAPPPYTPAPATRLPTEESYPPRHPSYYGEPPTDPRYASGEYMGAQSGAWPYAPPDQPTLPGGFASPAPPSAAAPIPAYAPPPRAAAAPPPAYPPPPYAPASPDASPWGGKQVYQPQHQPDPYATLPQPNPFDHMQTSSFGVRQSQPPDQYTRLRGEIEDILLDRMLTEDYRPRENHDPDELLARVTDLARQIIAEFRAQGRLAGNVSPPALVADVVNDVLRLGPLQDIVEDPEVTRIMVNAPDRIFVQRRGQIQPFPKRFVDSKRLVEVINRLLEPTGQQLSPANPLVEARLEDGTRVSAAMAPISRGGPMLTLRKSVQVVVAPEGLLRMNVLSPAMMRFLQLAVQARQNIVICGEVGSGKSTLLGVLCSLIPDTDRIVTVEEDATLQLRQPHWVALESTPPNSRGTGGVDVARLVRHALRLEPGRLVLGECSGPETLEFIRAMASGHDGTLTTTHAQDPRDALFHLESLCQMAAPEMHEGPLRRLVGGVVHLLVFLERYPDGIRRISRVVEVAGSDEKGYRLNDVYTYEHKVYADGRMDGRFAATNHIPRFVRRLQETGTKVPFEIFS